MADWTRCPRCGEEMEFHSMRLPRETVGKMAVCGNCEAELAAKRAALAEVERRGRRRGGERETKGAAGGLVGMCLRSA